MPGVKRWTPPSHGTKGHTPRMFSIDEYFNKSGFGDGDDAAALAAGYQYRERAIRLLNEAFSELKLPVRTAACEVVSGKMF